MTDLISLEIEDQIATIYLNDPTRLNPMSPPMADLFYQKIQEIGQDSTIRAMIVTGSGKAFSAGGDLAFLEERIGQSPEENSRAMRWFYSRFLSIRALPIPTIAAINGAAIGAGLSMTLACDYRVCADSTKLGFTFSKLGLHPGMATTFYLPKRSGLSRASKILASGELFSSEDAFKWGIVDELIPAEAVVSQAKVIAGEMIAGSPMAVRLTLETLRKREDMGLEDALERESWAQAASYASQDYAIGIEAIKSKTTPVWK